MIMLRIGFFCLTIVPFSLCDDISKLMSKKQIQQIFETDADSVPEHEVIEIHFPGQLHNRKVRQTGTHMKIRAFNNNISLWLHPRDSILACRDTPVYYARYSPGKPKNVEFTLQHGLMKKVGRLLEDPIHLASMVIGTGKSGKKRVNGRIESSGLVIKSLPQSVVNKYLKNRQSINDDSSNSTYHVAIKMDQDSEKNYPHNVNETMLQQKISRSSSKIPRTLYPEVLVVVEYSVYKAQGRDIKSFLEYLLAFWNGVDLKYRCLKNPKVRIHISGIVIGLHPRATPYVSNHMIDAHSFRFWESNTEAPSFFYAINDSLPLNSYDVAVTITRLGLGQKIGREWILGTSLYASICNINTIDKTMGGINLVYDDGIFKGVHSAAHELGHILGINHDPYVRADCRFTNGYIMALTPWYTKNSTLFSKCSLEELQTHLNAQELTCLYNVPRKFGKKLPLLMPGKIKNLKEQCRSRNLGLPCMTETVDVCVHYRCLNKRGECEGTGAAALEGTPCGDENDITPGFCVHNECVNL